MSILKVLQRRYYGVQMSVSKRYISFHNSMKIIEFLYLHGNEKQYVMDYQTKDKPETV